VFAAKQLGDPLHEPSQRASRSLNFLDSVVRLLAFSDVIVDRFVALFSAHSVASIPVWAGICRHGSWLPTRRAIRSKRGPHLRRRQGLPMAPAIFIR
jgi:hypothetical protein